METKVKIVIAVVICLVITSALAGGLTAIFDPSLFGKSATQIPTQTPTTTPSTITTPLPMVSVTTTPFAPVTTPTPGPSPSSGTVSAPAPAQTSSGTVPPATSYSGIDYPGNDLAVFDLTNVSAQGLTISSLQSQYPNAVGLIFSVPATTVWVKSAWGTPGLNQSRRTVAFTSLPSTTTLLNGLSTSSLAATDMTTNLYVAPAPTSAPAPTCNPTACETVIDSYLAKNWAYTSSSFAECAGCPVVSFPNKLPQTSQNLNVSQPAFSPKDYVIWTGTGTDIAGNPWYGNLSDAETRCGAMTNCTGFSRLKSAADTDATQQNWFKQVTSPQTAGQIWQTFAKN